MLGKGRLNLSGSANTAIVTIQTTEEVRLAGTIAKVLVNTANANIVVNNDGTVGEVQADQKVNLVNNGAVAEVSGTAQVDLSGTGEVTKATNTSVTTNPIETPDQALTKKDGEDLLKKDNVYSASFNWSSTNGIGTNLVEKSGRYNYFNDGAYLDITVKKVEDTNVAFESVFQDMTLVTDSETANGRIDNIKGTGGRQAEDWAGTDGNWKTKLKTDGTKAVFYGVRQTGTGTTLGATRTVGFNPGDSRKIDLTLTPKADLEAGIYTVTIQPKQQTGPTSGQNLGDAITYSFTIEN